jgi:hypothetical protein
MSAKTLVIAAVAWAALGLAGARAEKRLLELPAVRPAADVKSTATSSDPAEPPMQVEMRSNSSPYGRAVNGGQKVEVASCARGTTLKLPTSGGYNGSASVTFKNSSPPMRFKMELSRMPSYDLQALTLTSGTVSLQVGAVSSSATTRYFNAKGQEQESSTGAAYTVTARRGDNGLVVVELRRAAGATLGKSLSISWQSNLNNIEFGIKRLRGG